MNINHEKLYSEALLWRDNKMEGISDENSQIEAENLFLQLAELGHSKAKHNYASIQFKKGNFELAYEYFTSAGLEASRKNCVSMVASGVIKEDICLVVGSNRTRGGSFGILMDSLFGNYLNHDHLQSFDGKAVTFDLTKCSIPGAAHIVGDCQTYDFAKKYNIRHVLLERLPTSGCIAQSLMGNRPFLDEMEKLKFNFIGACIENLSKAMKTGAILEIELDPYMTMILGPIDDTVRSNPFHGMFSFEEAVNTPVFLHFDQIGQEISIEDRATANVVLMDRIRKELHFYHDELGLGASYAQLIHRVYWEAAVNQNFYTRQCKCQVLIQNNMMHEPTEEFEHLDSSQNLFAPHFGEVTMQRVSVSGYSQEPRSGYVYDHSTFLTSSYLNFILSVIAVERNTPEIVRYLQSVGFGDVTVERRTNEHNGRQNVWMVRAVKV